MINHITFNKMVSNGEKIYLSKDPDVIKFLDNRKKRVKKQNEGVVPCIDKRYRCLTCGNRSGKEHPETAFCFICDTDNWEPVKGRKL